MTNPETLLAQSSPQGAERELKMKYTIVTVTPVGSETMIPVKNKREAIKAAKEMAAENPKTKVYISWFRPSDGQTGHLNRDGNYSISGKAW